MPTARLAGGRKADAAMRASAAMLDEKLAPASAAAIEAAPIFSKQDLFDDTLTEAIKQAKAFLSTEIEPHDPRYAQKWAIKASLIASVLNTGVKIDENELRRQKTDGFDDLMKRVQEIRDRRRAAIDPVLEGTLLARD